MKEYRGFLEVTGDRTARLLHPDDRTYTHFNLDERHSADVDPSGGDATRWIVRLDDAADIAQGQLSAQEWDDLFTLDKPTRFAEAPSVHNSWCKSCPSVGISHGVCCP